MTSAVAAVEEGSEARARWYLCTLGINHRGEVTPGTEECVVLTRKKPCCRELPLCQPGCPRLRGGRFHSAADCAANQDGCQIRKTDDQDTSCFSPFCFSFFVLWCFFPLFFKL